MKLPTWDRCAAFVLTMQLATWTVLAVSAPSHASAQASAPSQPTAAGAEAGTYIAVASESSSPMASLSSYRAGIKHGVVRFRTQILTNKNQRIPYTNTSHQYDIIFDGTSIRCDHARHAELKGTSHNFFERRVITKSGYIHQNVEKAKGVDYGPLQDVTWFAADDIFDPRTFGITPAPIAVLKRFSLDEPGVSMTSVVPTKVVNGQQVFEMRQPKVSEQDLAGAKLQLVEWSGGKATYNPQRGFALERLETTSGSQKLLLTAEFALFPGNVWFPARLEFKDERNGKTFHHEVTTVEADFATPVPPSRFTLQGMDLPTGTLVTDFKKTSLWDGTKLVPAPKGVKQRKRVEPGRAFWMRPPYAARMVTSWEVAAGRGVPVSIRELEPPEPVQQRIATAEKGQTPKPATPQPDAKTAALIKRGKTPEPTSYGWLYYTGIALAVLVLAGVLVWRQVRS